MEAEESTVRRDDPDIARVVGMTYLVIAMVVGLGWPVWLLLWALWALWAVL